MVSQNSPVKLQRQMRNVRGDLSEHADEAVKKARWQFDWRRFVANHPWVSLGTAAAVGYYLVPRRACCKARSAEAAGDRTEAAVRPAQPTPLAGIATGVLGAVAATIAHEGVSLATSFLKDVFAPRSESLGMVSTENSSRDEWEPGHAVE